MKRACVENDRVWHWKKSLGFRDAKVSEEWNALCDVTQQPVLDVTTTLEGMGSWAKERFSGSAMQKQFSRSGQRRKAFSGSSLPEATGQLEECTVLHIG